MFNNLYSQICCDSNQFLKGFLYKIKDDENRTRGYLFGTLHTLEEGHPPLDNRIFKLLSRSQSLFIEINHFDQQIVAEHFRNHASCLERDLIKQISTQEAISEEEVIQKIAKISIEERKKNLEGVEDLLVLKAEELKLEIKSLETEQVRERAHKVIEEEFKRLEIKRIFIAVSAVAMSHHFLIQAIQCIEESKIETALNHLLNGCDDLERAIKNTHIPGKGKKEDRHISKKIYHLIKLYEQIFNNSELKSEIHLINELKNLCVLRKNKDKIRAGKVASSWALGNKKIFDEVQAGYTAMEAKVNQLTCKWAFLRDEIMVDQIHQDLEQSTETTRSFYAMGAMHLIGHYENVKKQLKQKGWKIVNVYATD